MAKAKTKTKAVVKAVVRKPSVAKQAAVQKGPYGSIRVEDFILMWVRGDSVSEIAAEFKVATATVHKHASTLRALGVNLPKRHGRPPLYTKADAQRLKAFMDKAISAAKH